MHKLKSWTLNNPLWTSLLVCIILGAGWGFFDLRTYVHESRQINVIVKSLNIEGLEPAEKARSIQNAVRTRVLPTSIGKSYDVRNRPKLRHTAIETWNSCEGQCGEGARLLVNLLQAANIPATRVNLSSSTSGFAHTAAAYQDQREWILLDSINSSDQFFAWATETPRPMSSLVKVTMHPGGALLVKTHNPYFDRYSYAPWPRLFGTKVEINQFTPFPQWLTHILENPPLFVFILKFSLCVIAGLTLNVLVWLGQRLRNRLAN